MNAAVNVHRARAALALLGCLAALPLAAGMQTSEVSVRTLASTKQAIRLAKGPVMTVLVPSGARELSVPSAVSKGQRVRLLLSGLAVQQQPGVVYHVYLNLPANPTPSDEDRHRVGTLNFFNAVNVKPDDPRATRSFDLTDVVRRLQLAPAAELNLTIRPAGEPAANAVIARASIVSQ